MDVSAPAGGWVEGFLASWTFILVSEIGDKTFFIACLMAMRYPRWLVFAGAIGALSAMTVLSALMGVVVPNVVSVRVTQALATVLFIGFGVKILYDTCKAGDEDDDDEMAEAAAAISSKRNEDGSPNSQDAPNTGSVAYSNSSSAARWGAILNPVFVQAFTLTFVAEWGDRSQVATIALAAAKNPYGVTLGGIVGHSICTGGAVLFGNLISSRISHKTINYIGGVIFVMFGIYTFYELVTRSHHLENTTPIPR